MSKIFVFLVVVVFFIGCSGTQVKLNRSNTNFYFADNISGDDKLIKMSYPVNTPIMKQNSKDIAITFFRTKNYSLAEGVIIHDFKKNTFLEITNDSWIRPKKKIRDIKYKKSKSGYDTIFKIVSIDQLPYIYFSWKPTEITNYIGGYKAITGVDIILIVINDPKSKEMSWFLKYAKTLLSKKEYQKLVRNSFSKNVAMPVELQVPMLKKIEDKDHFLRKHKNISRTLKSKILAKEEKDYKKRFDNCLNKKNYTKALKIANRYLKKFPSGQYKEYIKRQISQININIKKQQQKKKYQKEIYNIAGKYMIKECKRPRWDGKSANGYPVGQGCFRCTIYFGFYAYDYYRVCGTIVNHKLKKGMVYVDVTDGTFLGYSTSIYKQRFTHPSQIKALMRKLDKKATKEWNEHQRKISSKRSDSSFSFDSDIKIRYCSYYKPTKSEICNIDYKNDYWGSISYKYDSRYKMYRININKSGNWGRTGYFYPQRNEVRFDGKKYKANTIDMALKIIANLRIR